MHIHVLAVLATQVLDAKHTQSVLIPTVLLALVKMECVYLVKWATQYANVHLVGVVTTAIDQVTI